jgi:hypothetical protein
MWQTVMQYISIVLDLVLVVLTVCRRCTVVWAPVPLLVVLIVPFVSFHILMLVLMPSKGIKSTSVKIVCSSFLAFLALAILWLHLHLTYRTTVLYLVKYYLVRNWSLLTSVMSLPYSIPVVSCKQLELRSSHLRISSLLVSVSQSLVVVVIVVVYLHLLWEMRFSANW